MTTTDTTIQTRIAEAMVAADRESGEDVHEVFRGDEYTARLAARFAGLTKAQKLALVQLHRHGFRRDGYGNRTRPFCCLVRDRRKTRPEFGLAAAGLVRIDAEVCQMTRDGEILATLLASGAIR